MTATGKRERKFFATKTAAERFAGGLRAKHEKGVRGTLLSASTAVAAAEAVRVLEGTGIGLVEAARIAKATLAGAGEFSGETLRERYARACASGEAHWSARYARDMGKLERWVGKAGFDRKCAELTRGEVERLLRANGAASVSTVKARALRVMAVVNFRERPRRSRAEIEILTPAERGGVLRACERAEERRVVALLMFAGIRPDAEDGEISRLQWEAVGEKEIYVSASVSKTGTDRHVPVTGRLRRLLRGRPEAGPVCPAGWKRAWQRIRKAGGIAEKQDVLRHVFASNFLAAFGEQETKQAMGHTPQATTLFRFYRRAVTAEAGKRFFR